MALSPLASAVPHCIAAHNASAFPIKTETLVISTSSWDGRAHTACPHGQPQITVLKIAIAPHTTECRLCAERLVLIARFQRKLCSVQNATLWGIRSVGACFFIRANLQVRLCSNGNLPERRTLLLSTQSNATEKISMLEKTQDKTSKARRQ
jgi:hypothetical protein